jgi:hypothetical protein
MRAAALLLTAILTLAACAAYTTCLSPDTVFFVGMSKLKDTWAKRMTTEHRRKIVVSGGSSALFSIDGAALLQERGLPVVNKGLFAGFGVQVLVLYACEGLESGDSLVVAIEPGLLGEPLTVPAAGVQFSAATRHFQWVLAPDFEGQPTGLAAALSGLRPGADRVLRHLAKVAVGQPAFRYRMADAGDNPSGWIQTPVRVPVHAPPGHQSALHPDVVRFLRALKRDCEARGIKVVYSLPWAYAPPDQVADFRRENARFLLEVMQVLPVLKDPTLGGRTAAKDFADTEWHLTAAASARRTAEFGAAIQTWQLWTADELRQLSRQTNAPESR